MSPIEDPPLLRGQVQGVLERLKDEVPALGAVPPKPERRQGEGVRGVVGQVEPALQAKGRVASVLQPDRARSTSPSNSACAGGSSLSRPILTRFSRGEAIFAP